MRKYMDEDVARTLVQTMVVSQLDYGNSLLHGANKTLMRKLQLVQNSAARLITKVDRRCDITPILKYLHWLHIEARIILKILVLCFKCLTGNGPEYLSDLLVPYKPKRTLRSSAHLDLVIPNTCSKIGDNSFKVFSPKLWNELPMYIKSASSVLCFRKLLNTYLFKQHY